VEARTDDGRRRSDVEVILPSGVRVAIELQCSEITDAEWLDRHEDYVQVVHRRYDVGVSEPGQVAS
jgi:hypothetical protein